MRKPSKTPQTPNAGPEAILPLTDFRGDPWETGKENAVAFRAGILSSPVPAEFARKMRDDGKAAKATVTNLDGSPVKRTSDGAIKGEPLKGLTKKQRAALPPLDPPPATDATKPAPEQQD